MLKCPRDDTSLVIETHHGIEVDHCPPATAAGSTSTNSTPRATVARPKKSVAPHYYGEHRSDLKCPCAASA